MPRAPILLAVFATSLACARSVTPTQPPVNLTDVLRLGATVPLEDYIDQARAGIDTSGVGGRT